MNDRDQFAKAALIVLLQGPGTRDHNWLIKHAHEIAATAYAVADAMLVVREPRGDPELADEALERRNYIASQQEWEE
jgi:hypothetical protein